MHRQLPLLSVSLGLLVAHPAAAQARSTAPRAFTTAAPAHATRDSASASAVAQMQQRLRKLVQAQETFWMDHGTYTTDLAALGLFAKDRAAADSTFVQVIFAGGRGWSGLASHRALRGKGCVIYVGRPDELPHVPQTVADKRAAEKEGTPTCDAP